MKSRLFTSALAAALVAGSSIAMAQPTFTLLQTINVGGAGINPTDIVYYNGDAYVVTFGSMVSTTPVTGANRVANVAAQGGAPANILKVNNVLTATTSVSIVANLSHLTGPGSSDIVGGPLRFQGRQPFYNTGRGATSIDVDANGNLLATGDPGDQSLPAPSRGGNSVRMNLQGYALGYWNQGTGINNQRLASSVYFGDSILTMTIDSRLYDTTPDFATVESGGSPFGINFTRGVVPYFDGVTNHLFVRRTSSGNDSIRLLSGGTLGDMTGYTLDPTNWYAAASTSFNVSAGITTWSYGGNDYLVAARTTSAAPDTQAIQLFDLTPFPTLPLAGPQAAVVTLPAGSGNTFQGVSFAQVGSDHYMIVTRTGGSPANNVLVYGVDGAVLQGSAPAEPNITIPVAYSVPDITVAYDSATLGGLGISGDFGGTTNEFDGMALDADGEGNLYVWSEGSDTLYRINVAGVNPADPLIDGGTLAARAGFGSGQANVTSIEYGRNALYVVVRDQGTTAPVNSAVLRLPLLPNGTIAFDSNTSQPGIEARYVATDLIDVRLSRSGLELFITQNDGAAGNNDNIYRIPYTGFVLPFVQPASPDPLVIPPTPAPVAAPAPFLMSRATWIAQTGAAAFDPTNLEIIPNGANVDDVTVYDGSTDNLVRIDVPAAGEGTAVTYVAAASLVTGGPTTPTTPGIVALSSDWRGAVYGWDYSPSPNTNLANRALVVVEPGGTTVRRFQMTNTAGGSTYFGTELGEPAATQYRTRSGGMTTVSYANHVEMFVLDEVGQRILKVTVPEFVAPPIANGDANGDAVIDLADVTAIYNFVAGITGPLAGDGDVNNDTVVNNADGDLLVQHLVNGTPIP